MEYGFIALSAFGVTRVTSAAYIDPAVTVGLFSGLAGLVVVGSATAFVIWHRLRSKVSKTFGFDENMGKEVEDELTIDESAISEIDTKNNSSQQEK